MREQETTARKLQAALQDLARETLLALVVELGANDPQAVHMLLARYDRPAYSKADAVAAARRALAPGEKSKGFIDYWGAAEAAGAVNALLDQAMRLVEMGQAERAVLIYQGVLEEVLPAMAHADDSMRALGGTIDWALEGLRGAGQREGYRWGKEWVTPPLATRPHFTAPAREHWEQVPEEAKVQILAAVWCVHCRRLTTIVDYAGRVQKGDLLVEGHCAVCGGRVARLLEGS